MKNTEINYSIVTDGSTVKTGRFDTDNNGAFSTTITGFTTGTTTNLILSYTGDSNYNSVSKTIPLTVSAPSLLLSSDKPILSYADSESATLTATLNSGDNVGKTITFYNVTDDIQLGTGVTDSNGVAQCNMSYLSQGVGDVEFEASYGSLVSKIYEVQDCYRYDDASSDKISSYGSPIVYRGTGTGALNYNATNGYYGTISDSNEVMILLSELTGKDDFTIEFDASLNGSYNGEWGIAGICAYENNDNYSRLSCHGQKIAQRVSVNGSANESDSDVLTTVSRYNILHYKFTIRNNQIIEEVTRGTTLIGTRTISYTPTSNTKYGIALIWRNIWVKDTFIKNIKTKPL